MNDVAVHSGPRYLDCVGANGRADLGEPSATVEEQRADGEDQNRHDFREGADPATETPERQSKENGDGQGKAGEIYASGVWCRGVRGWASTAQGIVSIEGELNGLGGIGREHDADR